MSRPEFQSVKGDDGKIYAPDGRRVYPFTCPNCGHGMVAAKSMAMECGHNAGHGSCSKCDQFFHLEMDDLDGDAMIAVKWDEHLGRNAASANGEVTA